MLGVVGCLYGREKADRGLAGIEDGGIDGEVHDNTALYTTGGHGSSMTAAASNVL